MRRQRLRALRARVVALTQVAAGKNPETNEAECSKARGPHYNRAESMPISLGRHWAQTDATLQ